MRRVITTLQACLLVMALIAMVGCEVQYTPQVTALVFSTAPGTPHDFSQFGPAGTLSPQDASATAEAELLLTAVAFIQEGPPPNRKGDPREASYEEVWCGDIERECYQLCFELSCGIYDASVPRVRQFIDAVDERENEILESQSKGRTIIALNSTSFGSCAGTVLAGAQAYVQVTAANPEPISKTALAIGGTLVAGVLCGGSLIGRGNVATDQRVADREAAGQALIAEQAFEYLRQYGEELELEPAP